MTLVYTCSNKVIEMALEKLKDDGNVSRDAYFNYGAPQNLRREVTYRDLDFLYSLSETDEVEVVRSALKMLKRAGIVPEDATYDEVAFDGLRQEVKQNFNVPGTAVTPIMERLLYMLSSLKKPRRVISVGVFCGNTLVWTAGSSCGKGKVYEAEKIYGIDIDPEVIELARTNFGQLVDTGHIELIAEDGLGVVERLDETFDYVYLDADNEEIGKGLYLEILNKLYGKIERGGWVLAHDTTCVYFGQQLTPYLNFVRNRNNFSETISFDVDPFGLELSIK
jgi:predicted O-methyltransferase YrrM